MSCPRTRAICRPREIGVRPRLELVVCPRTPRRAHGALRPMNFLAHLWLAEQAHLPLAGALLGDYFRGALPPDLPAPLAASVQLHRRIDAVTDRHPLVVVARTTFAPGARRYAGILLDILYDHALALDWPQFSPEPLADFSRRAAQAVASEPRWFERAGGSAPPAQGLSRLLQSYATAAGIETAVQRTAARMRKPEGLLGTLPAWEARMPALREGLPQLLADLQALHPLP